MSHPFAEPGVDSSRGARGRSYSPMWLKVFAFERRGRKLAGRRKTKTETGDSDFFFFFLGCQRKSVWCASSCRKCIDVRHRHSSPSFNRAARIGLSRPPFFCFFSFLFKTSHCKKHVGWTPLTCTQSTWHRRLFAWKPWVIWRKN